MARPSDKGKPQPKGWHPQKATEKWKAYLAAIDKVATDTVDERARRDREEKAKTEYERHKPLSGKG